MTNPKSLPVKHVVVTHERIVIHVFQVFVEVPQDHNLKLSSYDIGDIHEQYRPDECA